MEACVRWEGLFAVLLGLVPLMLGASWWMVEAHASGTHDAHVTRHEYDQLARLMLDRFDRLEDKIDRIEPGRH